MRRPRRPMSTLLLGLSPRTDDDERQQMHALAGQGWSLRQIGRHLGRDHHAVRRCLARPTDYRIKYPDRPRDHRGCFVRREEYLQQLTLLTEAEQELRAVRDRVETAQRGQHPSPEEWMELQQRVRRLQALKTQLASGSVLSSRAPSPPAPAAQRRGIEPQHVRRDALLRRIQRGRSRSVSHPDGINLMCEFERLEDQLRAAQSVGHLLAIELKLGELESRAGPVEP